MKNLIKTLLGGVALAALATAPAIAGDAPKFHVTALHGGKAVNKTRMPSHGATHITYTFGVSTYVPASDLNTRVKLAGTYYTWQCCTYSCGNIIPPKQKMKGRKKSTYGKITHNTESYSFGCQYDPMVFYGDAYKLTNPAGEGHTDSFVSILYAWFKNQEGTKYKGTLNLDVSVSIGN